MIRKLATVGAIVTGVVVLFAGPAFAHVEIERDGDVSSAGVVAATLHVPNEDKAAGTVKIELVFPASPKLTTAEPEAVNGWTATVQKNAAGDVTAITWTGGPLTGEDEVALPLSIGDVPDECGRGRLQGTADLRQQRRGSLDRAHPREWGGARAPGAGAHRARRGGRPRRGHGPRRLERRTPTESSDDSTGVTIAIIVGILVVLVVLGLVLSRTRREHAQQPGLTS